MDIPERQANITSQQSWRYNYMVLELPINNSLLIKLKEGQTPFVSPVYLWRIAHDGKSSGLS